MFRALYAAARERPGTKAWRERLSRSHSSKTPFSALSAMFFVLLVSPYLRAHEPFEITTDARVHADRLELRITMASRTASAICKGLGTRPSDFEQSDLDAFPKLFEACAFGLYAISSRGTPLAPLRARVELTEEHDFQAVVAYSTPGPGPLRFDAVHLKRLVDRSYGATLTVVGEGIFLGQSLLRADEPTLEVMLPEAGAEAQSAAPEPRAPSFGEFFRLGVEHILTGYDHLLFLLGVLLGCRGLRSALLLITSFTLAHSLTLGLSALDLFTLPSRWVEPLIAASIVFVGVENLLQKGHTRARYVVTFAFGLIHGFGFAGVLRELGLGASGAPILLPLLSFNLGVELGQAAVAGLVLPILFRLYEAPSFERWGRTGLSLLVSLAGLYWLIDRTLLSS